MTMETFTSALIKMEPKPVKTILVVGKAQSGKSTTCNFLMTKLEFNWNQPKIYSFADPLKQFVHEVLGVPKNWLYGTNDEKNSITHLRWMDLPLPEHQVHWLLQSIYKSPFPIKPNEHDYMTARQVLQVFGSDIIRKWYNDAWAVATRSKIINEHPHYALIADARFPNEIDCFTNQPTIDPIIIRLTRNPIDGKHISETALDNYDFSKLPKYIEIDNTNLSMDDKHNLIWNRLQEFIHE